MTFTLLCLFAVGLVLGFPIAICLGLSSAITILVHDLPFTVVAQRSVNALDSTPLLAVPLFIFAAALLSATGVTNHLFDLTRMIRIKRKSREKLLT